MATSCCAKRSFWPNFFSRIVARLQWNPAAIDLAPDARAWPDLPDERRARLTTLLAGFCVAEEAVAEHLTPFADAARGSKLISQESLMAWVFFLQRRDEQRHARLFDRIGAEVLATARRFAGRAASRSPGPRPGRAARAFRGAAADDGRGARRGSRRTQRERQPLPHAARGSRLRRRAARAARRPRRRRPARGARGRRAGRARRTLARRLRPALPDRDQALPRRSSKTCWSMRRRPPRPGATPSPPRRASAARASARTGCTPPG